MKKLTKLTKKQVESLPRIAKDWIELITSGTTDDDAAKLAVNRIYERGKLTPPKYTIILDDPIQCLWGRFYAAIWIGVMEGKIKLPLSKNKVYAQVDAQVGAQIDAQVGAQVYAQVGDQVDAQVYDQIDAQVYAQVDAQVGAQVYAQVGAQVGAQIDAQVGDQIRAQVYAQVYAQVDAQVGAQIDAQIDAQIYAQVGDQVDAQVYDQIDAQVGDQIDAQIDAQIYAQVGDQKDLWQGYTFSIWWSAWRKYREVLMEFLGQEYLGDGWMMLDRARVSWSWLYPNIAILCRMPKLIRNERGQLHCDNGAAIVYPSGLSYWFYNGVRVNEKIIMTPEKLDLSDIENEKNEEVRRIIIERMGERFVELADLKVLQEDKFGKLVECSFKDNRVVYANVSCPSTGRMYYLRVPATLEDSLNMLRVSKGVTWEEWNEEEERKIWPKSEKMETCQQACAWTFGVSAEDYYPIFET